MSRELSVGYGAQTYGTAASGREITGYSIATRKFEEFSIEFEFFISKTTEAAFSTEISDVETNLRTPFQNLTVTQGSATLYSFSQSGNTGLDAKPEILKREDTGSGRHRKYRARISIGLPANTGAELYTGLREHGVEVAYDTSRIRTVTITGMFTAAGSNNARAQYEAQIGSLESSVLSALSIISANRELAEEPVADHSYNTKTLRFRRVWRELIFSQGGSTNDDSALKRQVLQITRLKEGPGDTPDARRLVTLSVNYSANVDKDVSTDLRGKYTSIRAWIITQVRNTLGGGTVALIEDEPQFNYDLNIITARLLIRGLERAGILEHKITIADDFQTGWVLVPAWTGDTDSKYEYKGPRQRRRTVTDVKTVTGFVYSYPGELSGDASIYANTQVDVIKAPDGMAIRHISSAPQFVHRQLGREGIAINVTDIVKTDVFDFFKPVVSKPVPT